MRRTTRTAEELRALAAVARGDAPADLFLEGGRVLNVFSGEVLEAHVAVAGGRIAYVGARRDAVGAQTRIVPADALVSEARAAARRIADAPREATAVTKRMLGRESTMTFDQALRAEARAQSALMLKKDFREAYRAFMEKREPRFNR